MPLGPLALCDLVGLDVLLAVTEYFYKEFGDSKFRPSQILKQKVRAGHLGVKTGRGFLRLHQKVEASQWLELASGIMCSSFSGNVVKSAQKLLQI